MNKRILKLAIPNVISNITVPFVGIVDIALVGRMDSSAYIGGVGFGTIVFTLIYTGLGFLKMGTTGITSQAFGASDYRETANSLLRALMFALLSSVLLIALQTPIKNLLILRFDGATEALNYAADYFNIRIWAAPATLSVFVFMGWFVGMQNTKIPMIITIVISITNIILSSLFVISFDMKIEGVALGTLLSQYLGLILSLIFFFSKYKKVIYLFQIKDVFIANRLKRFFNVSGDIFIRSLLLTGSFFLFNAIAAEFGDVYLALNSLMLQFLWFFAWIADGFAYAGGTLTGRYIGANDYKNLLMVVRKSLFFGLLIAIIFTLFYMLAGDTLVLALTDNKEVINMVNEYHVWLWLIPISSFAAFLYDGIYVGATATATMRNIMLVSVIVIFVPTLFIFKNIWGNHGMWLAIISLLTARGVGLRIFLKKSVYSVCKRTV